MPNFSIPQRYRSGLQELAALRDQQTSELFEALGSEQPTLLRTDLISHVAAHVGGIPRDIIQRILDAVIVLYSVRAFTGLSVQEFSAEVAKSDDLKEKDESRIRLEERLSALLKFEPLMVTSKAVNILTEHEHTFHDARILTDVRPIFREDASTSPAAAVIVHMLKVTYHQGSDLLEFFVALDSGDVQHLRSVLDRARGKENSLKSVLDKAGVPLLQVEMRP